MRFAAQSTISVLVLAAISVACSTAKSEIGGSGTPDAQNLDSGAPTTCDAVKDIFSTRCALAGCHTSAVPPEGLSGGLDLQRADIGGRILNKPAQGKSTLKLIDAINPEQSVLYTKLLATRPFGLRMPLPVDPPMPNLSQLQIDCVKIFVIKAAMR